jgi:hypothetical protein
VYGIPGTSNPIEARMNKYIATGTGMSLPYGALSSMAQRVLTSLSRNMTEVVFSVVGDQQGECKYTKHTKKSGRTTASKTGSLFMYYVL